MKCKMVCKIDTLQVWSIFPDMVSLVLFTKFSILLSNYFVVFRNRDNPPQSTRHLSLGISIIFSLELFSFSILDTTYSKIFKNIQDWIFIPFLDELDNSKHLKLKTLKRWFSAQNPIMWAIFGPKNGFFWKSA